MTELNSRRWVLTCAVLRTADAGVVLTLAEPRTGQAPSPQTCCAPGATMQHGSCFPAAQHQEGQQSWGRDHHQIRHCCFWSSSNSTEPPRVHLLLCPAACITLNEGLELFPAVTREHNHAKWWKQALRLILCKCLSGWPTREKTAFYFLISLVYTSGKFTVQLTAEKSYKVHTSTEVSTGGKLFFSTSMHSYSTEIVKSRQVCGQPVVSVLAWAKGLDQMTSRSLFQYHPFCDSVE